MMAAGVRCPGCDRRFIFGGVILDRCLWHRQCAATAQEYERRGYDRAKAMYSKDG